MKYAHSKDAAFVALVGETELLNKQVVIKNMETGDQKTYPLAVTNELLAMVQ
jgi:histidyl-tRNA synthetase